MTATTFSVPTRYRYPLTTIHPDHVSWGGYKHDLLIYREKVLTVCFVARVVNAYFKHPDTHEPAKCASIRFRFLRAIDLQHARALVYAKAVPPRSEH